MKDAKVTGRYIAVDFDGTCVDHSYPDVGEEAPHCLEVLRKLLKQGDVLVLNTMRSGKELQDAIDWFAFNFIPLYGVNHNPDQDSWTTSSKTYAHVYVDDAALGCPLLNLAKFKRPCVDWEAVWNILKVQNDN